MSVILAPVLTTVPASIGKYDIHKVESSFSECWQVFDRDFCIGSVFRVRGSGDLFSVKMPTRWDSRKARFVQPIDAIEWIVSVDERQAVQFENMVDLQERKIALELAIAA